MRLSISEAIEEAGLKKKFVAKQLDVSETYLNTYLLHPERISFKNATLICKLVNRDFDELDFGQD